MRNKRLIAAYRSNVIESVRLAKASWRAAQYDKRLDRGRGIYSDDIELGLREAWYYLCLARRWKREMLALIRMSGAQ